MSAGGDGRRVWPAVSAWALWLLVVLALVAVPLLDRLLRQAGRADLVQLTPGTAFPVVATVSGATVGVVLPAAGPATRWAGCWCFSAIGSTAMTSIGRSCW